MISDMNLRMLQQSRALHGDDSVQHGTSSMNLWPDISPIFCLRLEGIDLRNAKWFMELIENTGSDFLIVLLQHHQ